MFKLLSGTRTDRRTQVFCDTAHHIEIVYPLHEHSGEGPGLDLAECDCPKIAEAPMPLDPPNINNAVAESDIPNLASTIKASDPPKSLASVLTPLKPPITP